jgi:hypothetical protein
MIAKAIAIVEDEKDLLSLFRGFRANGFRVCGFTSSEEALSREHFLFI